MGGPVSPLYNVMIIENYILQDMLGGPVSPLYMIIENYITTGHVGRTSQSIIHDYRELHYYRTCWEDQSVHYT